MKNLLIPLYFLLGLLHLYAEYIRSEALIMATKPLLLALLALWFFLQMRPLRERFPRLLLAGLAFSWGGDVLLMLVSNGPKQSHFFLLGLGGFLFAQLNYMAGFWNFPGAKRGHLARAPWRGWPFVLFLVAILGVLWPGLGGGLHIPVAVYACAITGMALAALNLRDFLLREHFLGLMAGVLLFLLSDSLIALDKFRPETIELPYVRLWIMATYLLGQYFIAANAVKAWRIGSQSSAPS